MAEKMDKIRDEKTDEFVENNAYKVMKDNEIEKNEKEYIHFFGIKFEDTEKGRTQKAILEITTAISLFVVLFIGLGICTNKDYKEADLEPLTTVEQDFDNSFLQFREGTEIELIHADELERFEILEHNEYDKDNPVYAVGMPANTTVRSLKNKIKNDNIRIYSIFEDEEIDDHELAYTGIRIVVKVKGKTTDIVTLVITGDVFLDGKIDWKDRHSMKYDLKFTGVPEPKKLASDVNQDGVIDGKDYAAIKGLY